MAAGAKRLENMEKNLTRAETEARAAAEQETIPDRGRKARLAKPKFVTGSKAASRYWREILRRMEGLSILDDLDSEMLAGYCSMLARRDQWISLSNQLMASLAGKKDADPDTVLEAVARLDSVTAKLQTLERNLLTYADKLGLTPTGRVRLAQKRAEAAAVTDPDSDLYGG